MSDRPRRHGEFCWFNLLTRDPKEEQRFFTSLLNWNYFSMGEMGDGVEVSGEKVGGFFDLDHPNTPAGTAPQIGVMIKVDSVDVMLAKAASLGAKVRPPMQIGQNGRMGMVTDPTGVAFDLWQPSGQPAMTPTTSLHGAPSWWELTTGDTASAGAFYSKLFGWQRDERDMGGAVYTSFKLADWGVGGMMPVLAPAAPMQPAWRVYFTVPDADAAAKQARALGGQVSTEPRDIPTVGRFAGLTSPRGVSFNVIQYANRGV